MPILLIALALLISSESFAYVFARDNRTEVKDLSYPYGSVGKLWRPKTGSCTATLVGPDLILTNAHCVFRDGKREKNGYEFQPGFSQGKGALKAKVIATWPGTTNPDEDWEDDWAFMRIDKRLGDDLDWFDIENVSANTLVQSRSGVDLQMVGYSADFKNSKVLTVQNGCGFTGVVRANAVLHNCSGIKGASGSPIFMIDEFSNAKIVGLHAAELVPNKETFNLKYLIEKPNIGVASERFYSTYQALFRE